MTLSAERHLALPDSHNIRDLGGYARRGGGITQWRRILRGEAMHHLRPGSADVLVQEGLALVIDLRGPHETGASPHPFSSHPTVAYRNIALFDALAPIAASAAPFDMAQRYCTALDNCGPNLAAVLRAIVSAPPGLVLFHCTAGKDRTGVIAALLLLAAGVEHDDIVADYALTAAATGLLDQLRQNALQAGGKPDHVDRMLASDAATMIAMLSHLETRYGDIDRYLAGIGLTPSETASLVARLCQ
ncbi:MAG: tyrosine-protein phosphatase [Devosia sp.]